MSIDNTMTESWIKAEQYFQNKGFEEVSFEIDAKARGDNFEEALESLKRSTSGSMRFEKDDTELVFSYNPETRKGDLNIEYYDTKEDIEIYTRDIEDILEADVDYHIMGES